MKWIQDFSKKNSQYHSTIISAWPQIYSAYSWSQHTLFTLRHFYQTIFITQSYSSLLLTCLN